MPRLTQKDRVLRHLKTGGTINPAQAITEYGIYRLAAVIHLLREDGWLIKTDIIKTRNRYNERRYAKYSLLSMEPGSVIYD